MVSSNKLIVHELILIIIYIDIRCFYSYEILFLYKNISN